MRIHAVCFGLDSKIYDYNYCCEYIPRLGLRRAVYIRRGQLVTGFINVESSGSWAKYVHLSDSVVISDHTLLISVFFTVCEI